MSQTVPLSADSRVTVLGRLECGDIFPALKALDHDGQQFDLDADDVAGRPTLLVFLSGTDSAGHKQILSDLQAKSAELSRRGGQVLVMANQSVEQLAALRGEQSLDLRFLSDLDGSIGQSLGLKPAQSMPAAELAGFAVLRANRHIAALFHFSEGQGLSDALARLEVEIDSRPTQQMALHPPVLVIPDVLSPEDCNRLMTVFNLEGNVWVEPGHGDKGMTSDYKMRIPEYGRGDRVDHWVISAKTRDFVSSRLSRRLFPEIRKAFQYQITKSETYRIAHYEGERGGDLHGHRDNSSAQVAYRRFAMSINLNAENFTGGEVRFPEFGDQRYQPPSGAAIVFSSSLLHEVTQVTSGERYVLLAFLFGDH